MKLSQDIITKNVCSSLRIIEEIESAAKYQIESSSTYLNGASAETYIKDGAFILAFHTIRPLSQEERNTLWGSDTVFICKNGNRSLTFDFKSFSNSSIPLMKNPARFECHIRKYRTTEIPEMENQFYRIIIPTKDKQEPGSIFESSKIKIDHTIFTAGLVTINFCNHSFHLFVKTSDDKKQYFIFVESLEKTDYQTFIKNAEIILLSYAFVTGYFPRDQRYVQSTQDSSFSEISGVSFEILPKSFSSNYSVVPSSSLIIHLSLPSDIKFPLPSFNQLCNRLVSQETFAKVLLLLVEGHNLSIELRAAVYSIALEAISDIIYKENKWKYRPIPSKSIARKVRNALKSTLDTFSTEISSPGFILLKNKISGLNSSPSTEKLLKPFELMQIVLDTEEIDCIKKRNQFLHGQFPFRIANPNDKFQIEQIALTLFYCVSVLILKYIDYSGYVTYYPALNQYKRGRQITTHFVKKI